ncbi:hypothetical protein KM043_010081 [Ampulex compressa]|nr:hypothetical protein KM043_010081 [Ampulex compressa]
MNETRTMKKDKNQHIQVFVRVRPINSNEKNGKSSIAVDVLSNKEVTVQERPQDKLSKKFIFDRVFGPTSKQIDVYKAVVSPLLEEVLAGYNCTVFAYGQTGTGKTFTMEGSSNDPALHWQSDTAAGMIPRSLSHLFDELRLLEAQEYTVRVSFLELYNEELFDLLSANDDASKIRLYEDAAKKGAVIIHGLEEVTVHNKSEVYKILEKGSERRQTAATLMNAHSSRSHTVFSITVHIKENTVDGEELLKTGKLNLVDLAGSENVGRSGAVDRRAREAGSINQSLLTLGRVITALVERAPHIPYRESKLTRLLQESLGGRTKTSIIATISPASINLEETLSTLDYAYRAKNITNRPEINQKLSKKALLKEYTEEIERLRRDLLATRERNGVYLAQDNYNEMQILIDHQGKEIEEKINHIKALEETIQNKERIFTELESEHHVQTHELNKTKSKLNTVESALKSTSNRLEMTKFERDEQKHLVEKHVSTEQALLSQAQVVLNVADTATVDTHKLHDKIMRKTQVEQKNETLVDQFRSDITQRFLDIENNLQVYTEELKDFCTSMKARVDTNIVTQDKTTDTSINQISRDLSSQHLTATEHMAQNVNNCYAGYQKWIEVEVANASSMTEYESELLSTISMKIAPKIHQLVETEIATNLNTLNNDISKKLEHISTYVKNTVDLLCTYRLEECDRLCKNVQEIKESIEHVLKKEDNIMKSRRMFAKMMEDLSAQFNLLNNSEEENYTTLTNTFNHVTGICTQLSDQASQVCNQNNDEEKTLQGRVHDDLGHLKREVAEGTEKNEALVKKSVEQSKALVNELQTTVTTGCDAIRQYKDLVECGAKEKQQKVDMDKTQILTSLHGTHKLVTDASTSHATYMEEEKMKASKICTDMGVKLESQSLESCEWSKKIKEQLYSTQHEIDKFFVDELHRDVPTGSTPARKEFSYPRQFTITSPHEKILQRFREARKVVETSDDDDGTLINDDDTQKLSLVSNELANVTVISPSLPLPDVSAIPVPTRVRSESDIYIKTENKENGGCEFLKPEKVKSVQPAKFRSNVRRK